MVLRQSNWEDLEGDLRRRRKLREKYMRRKKK